MTSEPNQSQPPAGDNSPEIFLRPRFYGGRFDGHAIPLEVLKDLSVIEDLVLEVAKWCFLKANPTRQRSPRGFTDGVVIELTAIEGGQSAIAALRLTLPILGLFPGENKVYFEGARDAIVSAIRAAEDNRDISQHLTSSALSYFDIIGRSLQEGEGIEFSTPSQPSPARLTKATRRRLLLASSMNGVTEEKTVRGAVPEADQDKKTCLILLPDGRRVPAPLPDQHRAELLDAFNRYADGYKIRLKGIARLSLTNRLEAFESIEQVSVISPLDVAARLDEIRLLRDGWCDGQGVGFSASGLEWLSDSFEEHVPESVPLPYLYPTDSAGIRAEWSISDCDCSLDIDLDRKSGYWHNLNLKTDAENTRELDLSGPSGWEWVVGQVRDIVGGTS